MIAVELPLPQVLMRITGALSFYDRFAMAPLVVAVARDERLGIADTIQLVSVYSLLYAVGQPFWGLISDRFGRVNVLRLALAVVVVGGAGTVVVSGYPDLLVARALAGLGMGALFPTLLTIVGDLPNVTARARLVSDLQTFTALGTTAATVFAGIFAGIGWRFAFVVTTVVALVLSVAVRAGTSRPATRRALPRPTASGLFSPVALWSYVVAFVEGAVLLGILTYIAPSLEAGGQSELVAGLLAGVYGLALIVGSRVHHRLADRLPRSAAMAIGGAFLVGGYGLAAARPDSAVGVTCCAIAIGFANSFLHAALLRWATEVAPAARGMSIGLFVSALFLGAAAGTAVTASLAAQDRFGLIFGAASAVAIVLTVMALTGNRMTLARAAGRHHLETE